MLIAIAIIIAIIVIVSRFAPVFLVMLLALLGELARAAANTRGKCRGGAIQIYSIKFKEDLGDSMTIYKDKVIPGYDGTYTPEIDKIEDIVWKDKNTDGKPELNDPVAYVSGRKIKIEVTFKVDRIRKKLNNVRIEAAGPTIEGGKLMKFKEIQGSGPRSLGGGSIYGQTFTAKLSSDTALKSGKINFFDPMRISWKYLYAKDGLQKSGDLGDTKHQLYVTRKQPLPLEDSKLFLTYLHLAVSRDKAKSEAQAIENTWSLFSGKKVTNWKGQPLVYYPSGEGFVYCGASNADEFLTKGYSLCAGFAYLFKYSLKMNGIDSSFYRVKTTNNDLIMLKNWRYETQMYPEEENYRFQLILTREPGGYLGMTPPPQDYGDFKHDVGIPGQNSEDPSEKVFEDHVIMKANGVFYDPSYGITYANEMDFEKKVVYGYAKKKQDIGATVEFKVWKLPEGLAIYPQLVDFISLR